MKLTSYTATGFSILGSFTVAMQTFFLGYCFFIVGAVGWAYVGIVKRDYALVLLNAAFLVANLIGLVNSF